MKKPALVIDRNLLPDTTLGLVEIPPVPANFFTLPVSLADRVGEFACESTPSLQRVIPYLVLINEDAEVFMYSRGKGGEEDRLKAKLSIGLGGHVDALPPLGMSNHQWFVAEARRELDEEVGLTTPVQIIFDGLLLDRTKETEEDGSVYVGQVHCGLLSFVTCLKEDVVKLEQGVIENGEWMSPDEILINHYERLEPWSAATIKHLVLKTASIGV